MKWLTNFKVFILIVRRLPDFYQLLQSVPLERVSCMIFLTSMCKYYEKSRLFNRTAVVGSFVRFINDL